MSGRTIVVGGGLSGLAAAYALSRRGEEFVLLESSFRPGGAVRTERERGFLLELGPNTVRPTAPLWGLIEELGLAGEALRTDPRSPRFVDFGGELHEVPMSLGGLAATRLLSPGGKLRLLGEPFVRRGTDPDESVRDFVTRRLGAQVADRLVEPFVAGIFAGDSSRLSAAAAFPALRRSEREHGSLLAGAIAGRLARRGAGETAPARGLLSFRDGLETLPRALARRLGSSMRPGVGAMSLAPRAGGWSVAAGAEELRADRVVLAAPAHVASMLIAPFAPDAGRALREIPHPPLAVVHLSWPEASMRGPRRGFGHLVAPGGSRRILGAVWSSSLFPGRAPEGRSLLTVFLGGTRDPSAPSLSDAALIDAAARDLESEGLVRGAPDPVRVTRWERAIPQYERGHAGRMEVLADTERRMPGLLFAGNYRGGVSVADVIRSGLAAGAGP